MNITIRRLIKQLETQDNARQEEAILFLSLLLEKQFSKTPNDPIYREVLPEEIRRLELAPDEKATLIESLGMLAFRENLPLHHRTSLIGAIGKCCHLDGLRSALQFLSDYVDVLDDENAYTIVVSITPTFFSQDQHDEVRSLLNEHQTITILERLAERRSSRLEEPVRRLLASIGALNDNP